MAVFIGLLEVDIQLQGTASLKEKRSIIKRLTAALKKKYNVSYAEVANNDRLSTASLAFSVVSNSKNIIHKTLQALEDDITVISGFPVAGSHRHIL